MSGKGSNVNPWARNLRGAPRNNHMELICIGIVVSFFLASLVLVAICERL